MRSAAAIATKSATRLGKSDRKRCRLAWNGASIIRKCQRSGADIWGVVSRIQRVPSCNGGCGGATSGRTRDPTSSPTSDPPRGRSEEADRGSTPQPVGRCRADGTTTSGPRPLHGLPTWIPSRIPSRIGTVQATPLNESGARASPPLHADEQRSRLDTEPQPEIGRAHV